METYALLQVQYYPPNEDAISLIWHSTLHRGGDQHTWGICVLLYRKLLKKYPSFALQTDNDLFTVHWFIWSEYDISSDFWPICVDPFSSVQENLNTGGAVLCLISSQFPAWVRQNNLSAWNCLHSNETLETSIELKDFNGYYQPVACKRHPRRRVRNNWRVWRQL